MSSSSLERHQDSQQGLDVIVIILMVLFGVMMMAIVPMIVLEIMMKMMEDSMIIGVWIFAFMCLQEFS